PRGGARTDHAGVPVPSPGCRRREEPDPRRRGASVLPTDARARAEPVRDDGGLRPVGARSAPADLRRDPLGRSRSRAPADAGARDLDEPSLPGSGVLLARPYLVRAERRPHLVPEPE